MSTPTPKIILVTVPLAILLIAFFVFTGSDPTTDNLSSKSNPVTSNISTDTLVTPSPTAYILPTDTPVPTIPLPTLSKSAVSQTQVITGTYGSPFGFTPAQFTVKVGIPVRLEVYAAEDGWGCMGSLMVPDFSPKVDGFIKGRTTVIEFTPDKTGEFYITCAMGIPHATLTVQ